jgi:hypothetical protein
MVTSRSLWPSTFEKNLTLHAHTAIKELVTDANFECNEEGINLQAMDNSHVALVAVKLDAVGEYARIIFSPCSFVFQIRLVPFTTLHLSFIPMSMFTDTDHVSSPRLQEIPLRPSNAPRRQPQQSNQSPQMRKRR